MKVITCILFLFFMVVPSANSEVPQMAPFEDQIGYALENALSDAYKLGDQEMISKLQAIGIKLESPPQQMESAVESVFNDMHKSLAHALKSAAIVGDLDIFKKVHMIGVDINGVKNSKNPPIVDAIQAKSKNIIVYIMNDGDFDVNKCGVSGFSALQIAAEMDNLDLVKQLIERGAKIDGCDRKGMGTSPYIEAANSGNFEICKFLLEKGADGAFYDAMGRNALSNCISKRVPLDIVKFMVKNGADVNARIHAGDVIEVTPIILAGRVGRKDIVNYLISVGADASYKDPHGKTAQDYLSESKASGK